MQIEQLASGRWVIRCWLGGIISTHDHYADAVAALRHMRGAS